VQNLVYVPVPGDIIDRRLADYINMKGKRFTFSKFLFLRESEGIYSYLKKRVFIQLQQDKLTIRVGGGFM